MPSVNFDKPGILVALTLAFCLGLADDLTNKKPTKNSSIPDKALLFAYSGLRINNINILGFFIDFGVVKLLYNRFVGRSVNKCREPYRRYGWACNGILIIAMAFTIVIAVIERTFL